MKKIIISLLFLTLLLTSCNKPISPPKVINHFSIQNMQKVDDENYKMVVSSLTESIDLKEYIDTDVEYLVNKKNDTNVLLEPGKNMITIESVEFGEYKIEVYKKQVFKVELYDSDELVSTTNFEEGSVVNKEDFNVPNKTGYDFDDFDVRFPLTINEDTIINLNYNKKIYNVVFIIDGVKCEKQIAYNSRIEFCPTEKTGYTFTGFMKSDGNMLTSEYYTEEEGNTFTAVYTPNKYKITYIIQDGSIRTQTVTYDSSFKLLSFDCSGYNFIGWYLDDKLFNDTIYKLDKDITLIGKYELNEKKINLNLETFGGNVNNVVTIKNGESVNLPVPEKEGFKFLYWTTDPLFKNRIDTIDDSYNNETLYAYYTLDSADLKYELLFTLYNMQTSKYDEISLYKYGESISASLYWHKIGIKKINNEYYVTKVVPSGERIANLGDYDYILLAYSAYPNYNDFCAMELIEGDKVNFLIDITTHTPGNIINIAYFSSVSLGEDENTIKTYLTNLYGSIVNVNSNIELVTSYLNYHITWTSSSPSIISTSGAFRPAVSDIKVTLKAYVYGKEIYSFTVNTVGTHETKKYLSTGYIYAGTNITQNACNQLDILYIAFIDIDAQGNFTNLDSMMSKVNANIRPKTNLSGTKIVISVNQAASGNFASVAADSTLREKLATNIANAITKYNLDGIDIDWETPTSAQKTTFTALMKSIWDKVKAIDNNLLVTAAIGGGKWQPPNYDMVNSVKYLDYINMMTYSMVSGSSCYQNALYPSTKGATVASCSIDESVKIYEGYGVPHEKILVGIPYYCVLQTNAGGPGSKTGTGKSVTLAYLNSNYPLSSTMKEYFDEECGVPYWYDSVNKLFVSLDNERSVKLKCEYIHEKNLAGMMFWQYNQDINDTLTNAIGKYINS